MDGRVRPSRIVEVLRELNADIVALQEVVRADTARADQDQAECVAAGLGMTFSFGETRKHNGGPYGNMILSRFPLSPGRNYDITTRRREPRGCLRADVEIAGADVLHVFNVHMGTAFLERRKQIRKLVSDRILHQTELKSPRIILGDFNEWSYGLTSRLLSEHFAAPNLREHTKRTRSYPGVLPFLHLDHIYHDPELVLERFAIYRTRRSLLASDHLPLVADFALPSVMSHPRPRSGNLAVAS
jgi:endonuclease/exonuclease/phosphatase family metal-dependent hydrolase